MQQIESTKLKAFEDELSILIVQKEVTVCHWDKNGDIKIVILRNLIARVSGMMHSYLGYLRFKKSLEIEDW